MSDLRTIDGVGPKTEEDLQAAGVQSVADLARIDPDDISHISGHLSIIKQARMKRGEMVRTSRTIEDEETGKKRYETEIDVRSPGSGAGRDYHEASPWYGQVPHPAVVEAVDALAEQDIAADRAPIKTEHVITWKDYTHKVVLSCEPGGKRVYERPPEQVAELRG